MCISSHVLVGHGDWLFPLGSNSVVQWLTAWTLLADGLASDSSSAMILALPYTNSADLGNLPSPPEPWFPRLNSHEG